MNVVVVGLGQRGVGYLKYLQRKPVEGLRVVGALEPRKRRRRHAQRLFPELRVAAAWVDEHHQAVFPTCDTVFVCTLLPARLAVLQNFPPTVRHVVLEKPIALPHELAPTLAALGDRTVHVPLVLRFTELFNSLRRVIRTRLDRPVEIHYRVDLNHRHGTSYLRRRQAEGFLQNKVCHDLDLLAFLLDTELDRVHLTTRTRTTVLPEPPEGKKATHCSRCEAECKYRFDPKVGNYVLVTDQTDLEDLDTCVYPLRGDPTHYRIDLTLAEVPVRLDVALFAAEGNRRISVRWADGHLVRADYARRTITTADGVELYNFQPRKYIGHQDGDVAFLRRMVANATLGKHTLFHQAQNLVRIIHQTEQL